MQLNVVEIAKVYRWRGSGVGVIGFNFVIGNYDIPYIPSRQVMNIDRCLLDAFYPVVRYPYIRGGAVPSVNFNGIPKSSIGLIHKPADRAKLHFKSRWVRNIHPHGRCRSSSESV